MKLVRFVDSDGRVRWGAPADAGESYPLEGDIRGSWKLGERAVRVGRILSPAEPPNIFAIGRNYREHAAEMKAEKLPEEPLVFLKATTSIIGPDDEIVLPRSAPDEVDFEAELAVVIGKSARQVSAERALEYVLGYTCANDVSARDCQKRRDQQWARGKSFDTFCPVGPLLVTADSISPQSLAIRSMLNGRVMQESNTSRMIFSISTLISFLSHQFTLIPGTLILTGTPDGVGAARTPPVFLRPGDEITVEIEGIGRLVNRVRGPSA